MATVAIFRCGGAEQEAVFAQSSLLSSLLIAVRECASFSRTTLSVAAK